MNVRGIMTGGDLLSQGAYGCVYHPGFKCKDYKNKKYKKLVAKIQGPGKSANNEEAMGKIVYHIPHSKDYFAPIVFSCDISKIDKEKLKQSVEDTDEYGEYCDIVKNKNTRSNLRVQYIDYINRTFINDHIKSIVGNLQLDPYNASKVGTFTLYRYFNHLLDAIDKLNKNNIVHFDLHGENIIVDIDRNLPIIIDFGLSFNCTFLTPTEKITKTYEKHKEKLNTYFNFNELITESMQSPLEAIFLNELNTRVLNTGKIKEYEYYKNEPELIKKVISNFSRAFNFMDPTFKSQYLDLVIHVIEKLKDKNLNDCYKYLVSGIKTWNLYSLSLIFLYAIQEIFDTKIPKSLQLKEFTKILLENIHPIHYKRNSISQTKEKLLKVFA